MIRAMVNALSDTDDLPKNVINRSIQLWESRVVGAESGQPDQHQVELGSFAWWFRSQLEPDWLMEQFLSVASHLSQIDASFVVVEKLPEFVEMHPALALKVLRVLVEKDVWGHVPLGHKAQLRAILGRTIDMGGDCERRSRELVNWLAARGLEEYGDLL